MFFFVFFHRDIEVKKKYKLFINSLKNVWFIFIKFSSGDATVAANKNVPRKGEKPIVVVVVVGGGHLNSLWRRFPFPSSFAPISPPPRVFSRGRQVRDVASSIRPRARLFSPLTTGEMSPRKGGPQVFFTERKSTLRERERLREKNGGKVRYTAYSSSTSRAINICM